jgi:hypothetical protein
MADRYATLVKQDDGTEVVSNISQMEGVPPEVRKDNGNNRVVKVADGVKIGMTKGGPVDPVGGFGWPEGTVSVKSLPSKEPPATSNPDEKVRATSDAKK